MKALITGGAGFIGSSICKVLRDKGDEVICLDNLDPYYDINIKKKNLAECGGKFVQGSVLDYELLKDSCEGVDYIFHEAAQAGVRASVEDPIKPHMVNTQGTLMVLKAALESGVKKVINASSSSVYGKVAYLPFDEKHPNTPMSPYGVSKLAAEHYCNIFSELHGLETINLRYFTVYGPRMRPDLAISIFTRNALKGETIEIYGSGEKTRDFTYIDDIVSANLAATKKGRGSYNIGAGNRISVNQLAEEILTHTNSSSKIIHSEDKAGDVEHTWADISKAKSELSWTPRIDIREGIRLFIDSVKQEKI